MRVILHSIPKVHESLGTFDRYTGSKVTDCFGIMINLESLANPVFASMAYAVSSELFT